MMAQRRVDSSPRAPRGAVPKSVGTLEPFLLPQEVAAILRVSKRTVYELVTCGALKVRHVGTGTRKMYRFAPADVRACMEAAAAPAGR